MAKLNSKIKWKPWTWGVEGIEKELQYLVDLLNKKGLTKEEAEKAKIAFEEIQDLCENYKESAWGDDL